MNKRIENEIKENARMEDVSEVKNLQNLRVKLEELSSALDILKNIVIKQYFYIDEKVNSSKYVDEQDESKGKFS